MSYQSSGTVSSRSLWVSGQLQSLQQSLICLAISPTLCKEAAAMGHILIILGEAIVNSNNGCMAWDRCAAGVQTHLCACLSCVCYMRAVLVAGFGYLIVATSTQCHVYACSNLNTPHIFDLKDTVTLILQVSDALTKYQPALIAMAAAKALLQYNIHASNSGCAPVCKQASLDC